MKLTKKALKHSTRKVSRTKTDKVVNRKITKTDYIEILEDAERWPLAYRIAAELFRSGLTLDEFEDMHFEENGISRNVYEAFMQFHLGKGWDPQKIHPVRAVYLRYVSPTAAKDKEAEVSDGRPSRKKALEHIKKLVELHKKKGWREADFLQALRDWDDENEPEVIRVASKIEEEPVVSKTRTQSVYMVKIGQNWERASTIRKAEELVERAADLEKITPVKNPQTHCSCCKFPLAGAILVLKEGDTQKNMHLGCYYMTMVHPSQLIAGMRVLSPAEGVYYTWHPVDMKGKGGWIKDEPKEPTQEETPKVVETGGRNSEGVPASGGTEDKPSETIPAEKHAAGKVQNLPKASGRRKPALRKAPKARPARGKKKVSKAQAKPKAKK